MADDRKMTIPELLEARDKIRSQLDNLSKKGDNWQPSAFASQNKSDLTAILEQIEVELAEQGYGNA